MAPLPSRPVLAVMIAAASFKLIVGQIKRPVSELFKIEWVGRVGMIGCALAASEAS